MSQFRLARISLILAAIGLNAAPALMAGAHAQSQPAAAPAAAAPKETVRPELAKLMDPVQVKALMDAKNFAEIQQRVAAAEALPNRTPYEIYVTDRTKLAMASASNNEPLLMSTLATVIDSGRLSPSDQEQFVQLLATYHFNAKNYPKAIELFKRYQKESATPEKVRNVLARAYYLSNDFAGAKAALLPIIAEAEQKGTAPTKDDLSMLGLSASKLKDDATYIQVMEKLVTYYPSDDYWTDLLVRMQRQDKFSDRFRLDVLRLQDMALKTMDGPEYVELAERALLAGFPTEAKNAMDEGFAAGVLGKGSNAASHKQLQNKANKQAADDAKNIGSGEASAAKSKDGTGLVNLGYAYVTMGQFDKGIGFIQQGIAKGGLKRADEANLRLGIAYAKAGRKADAIKVFEGLKSNDGLTELAKYWILYVNGPKLAPAAAAQPAPAPTPAQ